MARGAITVIVLVLCILQSSCTQRTFKIDGKEYEASCQNRTVISSSSCKHTDEEDESTPIQCTTIETYCSLKNLPYAKADRFGLPSLLTESERADIETPAISCPQYDPFNGSFVGDENCLVVDLYFPTTNTTDLLLFVILEGIELESSLASHLDSSHSMSSFAYAIAVVHYRTGVFGFLSLESEKSPLNLGLFDQQMALAFLHQQASVLQVSSNFILLGFGSGAVAASLHMLNDQSRQYFDRVLLSGGNALTPGSVVSDSWKKAITLAERLECDVKSNDSALECLKGKTPEEILEKVKEAPTLRFGAAVDSHLYSNDTEAFLKTTVTTLLKEFQFTSMKYVVYLTFEQFGLYSYVARSNETNAEGMHALDKWIRPYEALASNVVAEAASSFLFPGEVLEDSSAVDATKIIEFLTNYLVNAPMQRLQEVHLQNSTGGVNAKSFFMKTSTATDLPASVFSKLSGMTETNTSSYAGLLDDLPFWIGLDSVPLLKEKVIDATSHKHMKVLIKILSCFRSPASTDCANALKKVDGYSVPPQLELSTGSALTAPEGYEYNKFLSSLRSLSTALTQAYASLETLSSEEAQSGDPAVESSAIAFIVGLVALVLIIIVLLSVIVLLVRRNRKSVDMEIATAHHSTTTDTVEVRP